MTPSTRTTSKLERLEKIGDRGEFVTVCGSMRLFDDMLTVAADQENYGRIALIPFPNTEGQPGEVLDEWHRHKIDQSASIVVVHDGSLGESTREEVEYAEQTGKTVRYVECDDGPIAIKLKE